MAESAADLDRTERRPLRLGVPAGLRRDAPRLLAAGLSALVPGLGQLANGRRRLALLFIVPTLVVAAAALAVVLQTPRMRLLASLIAPSTLDALLALNLVLFVWRLVAVGHAFVDRRPRGLPSRWGIGGLLVLALLVGSPHAAANFYGAAARSAFGQFFASTTPTGSVSGGAPAPSEAPTPGRNERLNVLIVGLDANPERDHALTDAMIVASLDPVRGTASMVSIPRDMIGVPLGDGQTFAPKLNSLMSYANAHPAQFPQGGIRALEGAVGALLGIPIHYYATIDLDWFIGLVDAVGGVDVNVSEPFFDPKYDGWDGHSYHYGVGWGIQAGLHHLNGYDALAYARSRYAVGGSDFKRAARQQQILVALKQKVSANGELLFQLPRLLKTIGGMVRTDLPPDRLPDLAAVADAIDGTSVVHTVIQAPFVRGTTRAPFGSVQVPNLSAIRELAAHLFPPVGTAPSLWAPGQPASGAAASPPASGSATASSAP
ncbi:MAG TPA: LCP family protein [Candidatus Dormibacteraeota bacterium]|nr:LCP family protein [Candidatus Dormibacteraeota bacterium]